MIALGVEVGSHKVEPMRAARFQEARLELARMRAWGGEALSQAFRHAVWVGAHTLDVDRVGVWTFEDNGLRLRCRALYERSIDRHTSGETVEATQYPNYLRAIEEHRTVVANNAWTHEHTKELAESYLVPRGITSMMDAPIYRLGRVTGVVCLEHVGPPRVWTAEEQAFAASLADVAALLLEQASRVDAEATLSESSDQLKEAQRLETMGALAGGIAHEFNNALASILSQAELAQRPGRSVDELRSDMAEIVRTTLEARNLAQELLAFGRRLVLSPEYVDPNEMLRILQPSLELLCREHCVLELELGEPGQVKVDPGQLQRVVTNLAIHARDSMPKGGTLTVSTRFAVRAGCAYAVIEVRDNGVGMDEITRTRVFEPFFAADDEEYTGPGFDLSLATVHGIVEQSGGIIDVDSAPGKGSTFRVWLKAAVG